MHHPISAIFPLATLAAVCLAGCGSRKAAVARPPMPAATMVATNNPPRHGYSPSTHMSKASTTPMATGKHDRVGKTCSGRNESRFAGESMICITGRLEQRDH
jgi:hypothetical protein